jgi:hypothetical protein
MTRIFRAVAMHAFFLPRRDAIFQNFVASMVLRERAIAQAASLNVAFTWVLPFMVLVLFFYPHFRYCQVQRQPMRPDDRQMGIDSYRHQSPRLRKPLSFH